MTKAVLPHQAFEKLQAIRSRRLQMQILKRKGLLEATARYIERHGSTVRYGPFAGMVYPLESALSRHSIPKLLGVYEEELHGPLMVIEKRKYDVAIDIGSAEGYYAVGLARLLQTKVLAYDPEPIERGYCATAARINQVSGFVQLEDLFYRSDIQEFRDQRVLCVCDCEGYETELFTPESLPDLANWDVLIELHGAAAQRLPALNWPHRAVVIESVPRCKNFQELDGLGDQRSLLSEYRSEAQTWLWIDSQGHKRAVGQA